MTSFQDTGLLTLDGEIVLVSPWNPNRIIVTVTNLGQAHRLDAAPVSRYSNIGWFTFEDTPLPGGDMYYAHPVTWIEFEKCWFFGPAGGSWYPDGVYGIRYRLYAGVEAWFRIVYP